MPTAGWVSRRGTHLSVTPRAALRWELSPLLPLGRHLTMLAGTLHWGAADKDSQLRHGDGVRPLAQPRASRAVATGTVAWRRPCGAWKIPHWTHSEAQLCSQTDKGQGSLGTGGRASHRWESASRSSVGKEHGEFYTKTCQGDEIWTVFNSELTLLDLWRLSEPPFWFYKLGPRRQHEKMLEHAIVQVGLGTPHLRLPDSGKG